MMMSQGFIGTYFGKIWIQRMSFDASFLNAK
jgi:hypothetical protein